MTVEAVVFDYYGTLADAEAVSCDSIEAMLQRRDVGGDAGEILRAWRAMAVPDVERGLRGDLPPFRSLHDRWRDHGARLLDGFGIADGATDWADCRDHAHRIAPAYDDVVPTLDALRAAGVRCAVLSDADVDTLLPSIERNGFTFDAVVCSEELGCYKPHELLFRTVCDALGVAPSSAVYVGDNPRVDVVGARHAGLRSVWLDRDGHAWPPDVDPPDHTSTSLRALPVLLDLTPV